MIVVNAHCHLFTHSDMPLLLGDKNNVYISNALNPTELNRHLSHKNNHLSPTPTENENFFITTGQHPMYPQDSITTEAVVSLCETNTLFAVGEIGLDRRNKDYQWQVDTFLAFADIASQYHKPIVIHCVGKFYEVYSLIKRHFPHLVVILHSFTGSVEIVDLFSGLNTLFSIHRRSMHIKNSKNILKAIIETQRFFFETDMDADTSVINTIKAVSDFLLIPIQTLLQIPEENFLALTKGR